MKLNKILSVLITLSAVAAVAVFTVVNTSSTKNSLLMENIAALADDPNSPMNLIEDPTGGGGGSEMCWTWGVDDSHKSLRVCNTSTNKCYTKVKTTSPASGGSMKFCPY